MVHSTDLLYANHRGYTSWAAFADANTIPTSTALAEIRKTAANIVNLAYHNNETDPTTHVATLLQWELVVCDRLIADAHLIDAGETPKALFLTDLEFNLIRNLGDNTPIKSVSMYDKTNPFRTHRRGILY